MPYVKQKARDKLDPHIARLAARVDGPGELNYAITRLCTQRLDSPVSFGPTYADFNEVVGVLESAKLELYRRATAPYEDLKKAVNGDVY